jgi:hypothetical protein
MTTNFEIAFKPFEPMFHTVFYRRFPYFIREDAKQDALLGLWRKWKRNPAILDQSRAYVTQACLWAASPWRKKRMKIDAFEVPMPRHERYLPGPDTGWVQRVDLTFDVEQAICHVLTRCSPDQARALEGVVRRTSAGTKAHRREVIEMLRQELADYGNCCS